MKAEPEKIAAIVANNGARWILPDDAQPDEIKALATSLLKAFPIVDLIEVAILAGQLPIPEKEKYRFRSEQLLVVALKSLQKSIPELRPK